MRSEVEDGRGEGAGGSTRDEERGGNSAPGFDVGVADRTCASRRGDHLKKY